MFGHYAWERYGGSRLYAGGSAAVINLPPVIDEEIIKENDTGSNNDNYDPHLRSSERVSGYHLHATDGDIGHVKDFIIDDTAWEITDLVIDTQNWIGGHKMLLPVRHVKEIQWYDFKIMLDVSIAFIKDEPSFDETTLTAR